MFLAGSALFGRGCHAKPTPIAQARLNAVPPELATTPPAIVPKYKAYPEYYYRPSRRSVLRRGQGMSEALVDAILRSRRRGSRREASNMQAIQGVASP